MSEQHEMILEKTYSSGAGEWYCPICGRRMIIHWEPELKRTLLEAGDDATMHSASQGSLQLGSIHVDAADVPAPQDEPQAFDEDPRLIPWLTWLEQADFESLWKDEN